MYEALLIGFHIPFLCCLCQAAFPPASRGSAAHRGGRAGSSGASDLARAGALCGAWREVQPRRLRGPAGLALGPQRAFLFSVQPSHCDTGDPGETQV